MKNEKENENKRTLIAILASHDDQYTNENLARLLEHLVEKEIEKEKNNPDDAHLTKYSFIFTGGTFDRIILGAKDPTGTKVTPVNPDTRRFLIDTCGVIRLPPGKDGGVVLLTYLVTKRIISIIWSFITPKTTHLLRPDNLSLMRLCDQWSVKKLMNIGSILEWYWKEGKKDIRFNLQDFPIKIELNKLKPDLYQIKPDLYQKEIKIFKVTSIEEKKGHNSGKINYEGGKYRKLIDIEISRDKCEKYYEMELPSIISKIEVEEDSPDKVWSDITPGKPTTIALIAHDNMKDRMVEFASQYEKELSEFHYIITTGTTGKFIKDAVPSLENIERRYSGPKGGDIEIATEILYDQCDTVIFFVDPLNPHAHIDDIRVVFFICMIKKNVRMLSNELHAREWFDTVIRKRA